MLDVLLQIGAAKLVVSAVLAGLAWAVHRRVRHPAVTYPLWLLVLVALLLPAVVAVPVLPGTGGAGALVASDAGVAPDATARVEVGASLPGDTPGTSPTTGITEHGKAGLAITWLLVAAVLLVWTLVRAFRFSRWLARCSQLAPGELLHEATEVGRRLELARMPQVNTTTAHVSPMVCWTGGRVRLVIPSFLLSSLERNELRAVLAHELAHVRRRDHLVRWIEWLACSAFWWNPVAWWARRELRSAEEASCDALGAAAVQSTPHDYARSLLQVLEVMSAVPSPVTPTFASGVTSGRGSDSLERRLKTLVSGRSSDRGPRWVRPAGAVAAVCLLPLGLVYCASADPTTKALVESPMPSPGTTVAVLPGPSRPDSMELKELWGGDSVYAYWIFASSGHFGPYALADAPIQPVECRLQPEMPDQDARDRAMTACARAMSQNLLGTGVSDDRNVCVLWGSKASGWRGICEGREPEVRHRLHGNSSGSVLLERIAVAGSTR